MSKIHVDFMHYDAKQLSALGAFLISKDGIRYLAEDPKIRRLGHSFFYSGESCEITFSNSFVQNILESPCEFYIIGRTQLNAGNFGKIKDVLNKKILLHGGQAHIQDLPSGEQWVWKVQKDISAILEFDMVKKLYPRSKFIPRSHNRKYNILLPRVAGKNLEQLLSSGSIKWSVPKRIKILYKISMALADLHNKQMLHGDIRLSNIMYDSKYEKITFVDMGFSRTCRDNSLFLEEIPPLARILNVVWAANLTTSEPAEYNAARSIGTIISDLHDKRLPLGNFIDILCDLYESLTRTT